METYKKPAIVDNATICGLIPAILGLSAAKLAVAGVALGLGLGAASKGGSIVDSAHTDALTTRKDFSFT